jgi:hypothetical protein
MFLQAHWSIGEPKISLVQKEMVIGGLLDGVKHGLEFLTVS